MVTIVTDDCRGASPGRLAAVMVCHEGRCAAPGASALDALRPLIARTPRAILLRTGCVHLHSQCPSLPAVSGMRLQVCSDELKPLEPSVAVAGTLSVMYREVEAWLDASGSGRGRPDESVAL